MSRQKKILHLVRVAPVYQKRMSSPCSGSRRVNKRRVASITIRPVDVSEASNYMFCFRLIPNFALCEIPSAADPGTSGRVGWHWMETTGKVR
jgi:hypothetical protein